MCGVMISSNNNVVSLSLGKNKLPCSFFNEFMCVHHPRPLQYPVKYLLARRCAILSIISLNGKRISYPIITKFYLWPTFIYFYIMSHRPFLSFMVPDSTTPTIEYKEYLDDEENNPSGRAILKISSPIHAR